MLTADFFWKVFENTGLVDAYLLYRRLLYDLIYTGKDDEGEK